MSRAMLPCLMALAIVAASPAGAIDVGSDGSDGDYVVSGSVQLNLAEADSGSWNMPGDGHGAYDAEKWVVVYKFASVTINSGATLTFYPHPSGAPVVWLVAGDVTIAGTINLKGENGPYDACIYPRPGPGGFEGGIRGSCLNTGACAGFGPGGGGFAPSGPSGGGYGQAGGGPQGGITYGNERILPLIGGSGGSGAQSAGNYWYCGGGGGGAILIAANGTIAIGSSAQVNASGGNGHPSYYSAGGSGGGIRLIADTITGDAAKLLSLGGLANVSGGFGRIRVETPTQQQNQLNGASSPPYTEGRIEGEYPDIWPASDTPSIRILSVGGIPVPDDPKGFPGGGDVFLVSAEDVDVVLQAQNVPTDGSWEISVRAVPISGDDLSQLAGEPQGNETLSTWTATFTSIPGSMISALTARAVQAP